MTVGRENVADTRANEPSLSTEAETVASLLALAALLVQPGESPATETHALDLGMRLVPGVARWRLYATGAASSDPLLVLAEAGEPTPGAGLSPSPVATLGFGATVDRLVLTKHQPVVLGAPEQHATTGRASSGNASASRRAAGLAVPLVAVDGVLHGALVALAQPGATLTDTERQRIEAVAQHLTILVARRPHHATAKPSAPSARSAEAEDERMAFISLAAHELRSPLTSVKGYAQLLLRSARKDPEFPQNGLHALHAIEQQSTRMSDMVAELLDASRMQRGIFELHNRPVELVALVQRVVEQRRPSLEHHELRLEAPDHGLMGEWDGARVEQVVRDLLDNAIRYSPDGGVVTVRVAHVNGTGQVCIQDQGIGVSEDERDVIFEPFVRGATAQRRHLSGLGLGLYVSRTIVEALGGRLQLVSSGPEPEGSLFCFELPLAAPA